MGEKPDFKAIPVRNNNLGKFFSPAQSYMGYVFIGSGIFAATYSLTALLLIIPGVFLAYTYTGTIIDTDKKRVRPYTSHFGFIRTGKWIEVSQFSGFKIIKSNRRYTSYSRGSVRFDMDISDINLLLIYKNGSSKVVVNKYKTFGEAQKEKDELTEIFFPVNQMIIQ